MPVKLRFVVLLRLHYPDILEEWNPIIFALGQLRKQWKDRSRIAPSDGPSDHDILHYWNDKYDKEEEPLLKYNFFRERHQCLKIFWRILALSGIDRFQKLASRLEEATTARPIPSISPPPPYEQEIQLERISQHPAYVYEFSPLQKDIIFALSIRDHRTPREMAKALNRLEPTQLPAYSKDPTDASIAIDELAIKNLFRVTRDDDPVIDFYYRPHKVFNSREERLTRLETARSVFAWGQECLYENMCLNPPRSIAELRTRESIQVDLS
ncbi:MAG: hypothetical protein LQ350_004306 [Teloschistes chrysophthalmus]|nr:MAG: hypothetical protein LQ350_004306 [Niorma chrysophthalma]